jgi:hypothetical protein
MTKVTIFCTRILQVTVSLVLTGALLFVSAVAVRADCTNPAAPAGEQLYNADHKDMQFCDGTQWWGMKGAALDLTCAEGDGIVMTSAGYWDCSPGEPP